MVHPFAGCAGPTETPVAGQVVVQSRWPVESHEQFTSQPLTGPPPQPEFSVHESPWEHPGIPPPPSTTPGGGQLWVQSKVPPALQLQVVLHSFEPAGTAVPQPSPGEQAPPVAHGPGSGGRGVGTGSTEAGQISIWHALF
jgi:hypothetical protein